MNYLNHTETSPRTPKKGDPVIYAAGTDIIVGRIHTIIERNGNILITGYPIQVPSAQCILADDGWDAVAGPVLAAQAKKDKADRKAAEDKLLADNKDAKDAAAARSKLLENSVASNDPAVADWTSQGKKVLYLNTADAAPTWREVGDKHEYHPAFRYKLA